MDIKVVKHCEEEEQEEDLVTTIKEEPELLIEDCDDDLSGENEAAIRSQLARSNNQSHGKRDQHFNTIDFIDVSPRDTAAKKINCTLKKLLQEFKLENTYAPLTACGFTYERLRYINKDDLDVVFPGFRNTGLKAELREKIFSWKAKNFPDDVTNISSLNTKVVNWVQAQDFTLSETPTSSQEDNNLMMSSIRTQVLEILQASFVGQGLLSNYRKKQQLNSEDRKKLLNVIVEQCYDADSNRYIIPRPSQMEHVAEQIVKIFPTENKDIYYISRRIGQKHNPSGMLFNRYNNLNRKRKAPSEEREESATNKTQSKSSTKPFAKTEMKSLQDKMKCMSSDESNAMELWSTTYDYRCSGNQNLKDLAAILEEWPFYTQPKAVSFIDYDFEMLYTDKSSRLLNNWPELAAKLYKHYKEHLKDRQYKLIFQSLENSAVDKNCRDCILFMLLHAILKPTNRVVTKKKDGKYTVNRTTIKEGIYSCIVHVENINDLELARETKLSSSKDKTPYLIVIGTELQALTDFYVNYAGTLKQFSTFIASLDFCFKLFHIFHIQYPTESPFVWLFLQKYIFDIVTADDIKSHVLSEFLENVKH